jgi:uncharacterized phiE125 gp8 family phage protein
MEWRQHEATVVTPLDPNTTPLPVTVMQAMAYAGVTADVDSSMIGRLVNAAIKFFQARTGHRLQQTTLSQIWDGFPHAGLNCRPPNAWAYVPRKIQLQWAPVQSVLWVKYYDTNGVQQTLAPTTDYWTSLNARPPVLIPPIGAMWPIAQLGRPETVEVQYVAGYADLTTIEEGILVALMELVKHWYANRDPIAATGAPKDIPYTLTDLIATYNRRGYR